ncbi:MAG TPA: class I SAM-dependent methyltransferase, partial [Planctomycetaceae bacterium]
MQVETPQGDGALIERQARERDEYNRRATAQWKTSADLEHYSQSRFGPWNPYWVVWDFVLSNYPPGSALLSYGCGRGEGALRYASRGYQVSGFDISEELVRNAKELADRYGLADRATFSVQAAESLDYPDESFDVIAGENILHHIDLRRAV